MYDDVEPYELHYAAGDGNIARVRELCESGFDINAYGEDLSWTPLHYASDGGQIEVIKFLLSQGANVNAHDEDKIGETPLGHIAGNCSLAIAEVLVDAGADPTIPGWMGICALDRARRRKKEEGRMVYGLLLSVARAKFGYRE